MGLGPSPYPFQGFIQSAGSAQIDFAQALPQAHDMTMRIDQTGKQGIALAIVDGIQFRHRQEMIGRARGQHLAILDQHGLETLHLTCRIQGVAVDIEYQQGVRHDRRRSSQKKDQQQVSQSHRVHLVGTNPHCACFDLEPVLAQLTWITLQGQVRMIDNGTLA